MPTRDHPLLCKSAALFFIVAGVLHFVKPASYRRIVPPGYPAPAALVAISGAAEIAGGVGLLIPRLRRLAGWGLIAMLISIFPANVYMAQHPQRFADLPFPTWAYWARLPLQGVFIAWVCLAMKRGGSARRPLPTPPILR